MIGGSKVTISSCNVGVGGNQGDESGDAVPLLSSTHTAIDSEGIFALCVEKGQLTLAKHDSECFIEIKVERSMLATLAGEGKQKVVTGNHNPEIQNAVHAMNLRPKH